jgi:CRP-like cAMP-binding protein
MPSAVAVDRRALLASLPLLRLLRPQELEGMAQLSRLVQYPAGALIFRRGDPGNCMMVVVRGHVKISTDSPDGRHVILNIIDAGQVLGEIAMLDGHQRTADATAISETELLVLDRREVLPFLERYPSVCISLMTVLCARLRQTSQQVEDSLFLDLPGRLAKQLLHLAALYGDRTPDGIRINLKLPQRDLGSMAGASRESTNRQLHAWEEDGIVELSKGQIVLKSPELLKQMAEGLD